MKLRTFPYVKTLFFLLFFAILVCGCGEKEQQSQKDGDSALAGYGNGNRGTMDINILRQLQFKTVSSEDGLLCDEVTAIHQDREGFMWMGSRYGLFKYDGFGVKTYKNTTTNPRLLTSNQITCLADDDSCLWIGTDRGVNRMDKRSGQIRKYSLTDYDNCNQCDKLLLTHDGRLWLGTDGGLYLYNATRDSFDLYVNERGNTFVPHCSVKSIIEDANGYLWVGTWDKGLFRYNPRRNEWYAMPKFNDGNSAQALCADIRGRLWVGTWHHGLYRIDNPYSTNEPLRFVCFYGKGGEEQLQSNIIYSLIEEPTTNSIWVGNRRGLAILPLNADASTPFILYPQPNVVSQRDMSHGISQLMLDRNGFVWMHPSYGGALFTHISPKYFTNYSMTELLPTGGMDEVRYVDSDGRGGMFVSLTDNGLMHLSSEHSLKNVTMEITGRSDVMVNTILREGNTLYIGSLRHGFFVNDGKGITNYNNENTSWLEDNCIYCFCRVNDDLLIGTYKGLCIYNNKVGGTKLSKVKGIDISEAHVKHILAVDEGFWLSTSNNGLVFLSKDFNDIKVYEHTFTASNDTVGFVGVQQTLLDTKGRLWVACHETGLMLYDKRNDKLITMNNRFEMPDDNVNRLLEDNLGHLWLSTSYGIVRMKVNDNDSLVDMRLFTSLDGLPSNYYADGGIVKLDNGRIGVYNRVSVTTFEPSSITTSTSAPSASITGIRIFNRQIEGSDLDVADALPPFTRNLTLSPEQNDITIDFSTFIYELPHMMRFVCRMEGYDNNWIYLEPGKHSISYSHLPSGTYTFHLKSCDAGNVWSGDKTCFTLTVLPPLYLRWWAYLIYIAIAIAIFYIVVRYLRERERDRQRRHIEQMERKNADELNHKKLQFFTNITHDLMTPLTIIKASVEDMSREHKAMDGEEATTINSNIARLMRMLQQILAFRKAETGNLHLCVSKGDIVEFCHHEVESIMPLMKQKRLTLSFYCVEENIMGYFDSDVLDKILYNLLSNAAKYGKAGGYVKLELAQSQDGQFCTLKVSDNGYGIAKEKQKSLFKRFYEGEYRHFNTYGTGIGLSLTKDYVELCHGSITVDSEENRGTTFTITLPIAKRLFDPTEIEGWRDIIHDDASVQPQTMDDAADEGESDDVRTTILVVEDNEELLALMQRLLGKSFHVLTAQNARKALDIVRQNEQVELIVSDVMMPEMDGIEMTRTLKSDIKTSHIPIILLTAKRTDESRTDAYDAGADGYITKPFSLSLLSSRIHNLLHKRETAARNFKNKFVVSLGDMQMTDIDADFLRRSVDCIQQHLSDANFDQQQMADALGVSRSTLYKKLKSLTGMNVSAFMRNIRMKAACRIMEANPKIRISDLAFAVGYNDPKYFSTCFRKDFGIQPSEYVAQRQQRNDYKVE